MSREKQIEEMALELCRPRNIVKAMHHRTCGNCNTSSCDIYELCVDIYNAGYRKQVEGEWVDNHCTVCGMTPIGEETWTRHGDTPPKFEYFMSYCPCCGAKMKGGE